MPSMRAGDWMYERSEDEAEPFEAEPFEAEPLEAEPYEAEPFEAEPFEAEPFESDGEAEPEYDYRDYRRRMQRGRSYGPIVRGVQTAVVKTPSGNANIQLPSRVPTVKEVRT